MTSARAVSRTFLLLGSLVVAVFFVEAAFRMNFERLSLPFLIYVHPALRNGNPGVMEVLRKRLPFFQGRHEDADVGFTFIPRARKTGVNEDGESYDLTASAEGFFTPSVPDKSTPQLVTLGDSFLSTFYVKEPLAWTLQRELRMPVYNLAVGGWGPESYRAAYLKFAAVRAHSRVVVFTFLNDITDVLNWNGWQNSATNGESFLTWMQRTTSGEVTNASDVWVDRHLVLWNYLKFSLNHRDAASASSESQSSKGGAAATPANLETIVAGSAPPLSFQFTDGYPFTELDPPSFEPGANYYQFIQPYFESLARLKAAVASRGAQMVLVWIPSKERVYLPMLDGDRYRHHVVSPSGKIDGLERVMAAFAAQSSIRFLDLTTTLEEHARSGEKLYFTQDGHLNGTGNVVAGHAVADFLRGLPFDDPQPTTVAPHLVYRHPSFALRVNSIAKAPTERRASIVSPLGSRWRIRGRGEGRFTFLLQWPAREVQQVAFLVARGVVHSGGVTIGVRDRDMWVVRGSVGPGRFDLALAVKPDQYSVVVANNLPADSLVNDVEIDELGWAPAD